MPSFFEHNPQTLRAIFDGLAMPAYAADQMLDWVYRKGVTDPGQMSNLSRRDREALAHALLFYTGSVVAHQTASDGTQKLLIEWGGIGVPPVPAAQGLDDEPADSFPLPVPGKSRRQTECVMIPDDSRRTACVSSQVGCPVGCRFCASGIGGLEGNLTAGQIVEQVHRLSWLPGVGRLTNVVFMGMGEPLANFAAVTDAIRALNAPWGMGISARKITISTVGLPAAIRKLVQFELPITLALSLHAPNDELRRKLIPWAQYTTIAELVDACDEYFQKSGREITFEYILLRNVNDRPEHARELAQVTKRLRANVNLIRYNEVRGLPFDRPRSEDVHEFQTILRRHGVNAHIRASRGRDIAAACGQLRHEHHAGVAGAT